MGACTFQSTATGKTAKDAFTKAREQALYDHGHGGYTGTIAEKPGFRMVAEGVDPDPAATMKRCLDDEHHWCQDKWGDAACLQIGPEKWLFFGWASC